MSQQLDRLNPRQREAVLHGDGPLLILAGAGSGKTSTMAHRIAHLIRERRVKPSSVLGLSFTNKAARELKERVVRLLGQPRSGQGLWVSTFHSMCARILREHAPALGFQKNFTIVDQGDQKDILRQIFKSIKIDDRKFDLDAILFEIGQAKNRFLYGQAAESFFLESKRLSTEYSIAAASGFSKYQQQLRALNSMDFDDLLFYTVKLLEENEEVRRAYNDRFRYVLVDEYQDTNPAQFKLLRLVTEKTQNLCVVGDDDQSIYAWRGADPTHILEFKSLYKDAKVITLDQNYRSTTTILDAANQVISNNKKRHPKKLWSDRGAGEPLFEVVLEEDRAESDYVAEEILKKNTERNGRWSDFAVLYRSNTQSRVFEEAFRRNQIPYKIVGSLSFLERKEVKDALSLWRLVVNLKDDASLRRVLSWMGTGIGKSSLEALNAHAFTHEISLFECLDKTAELAPRSAASAKVFQELIHALLAELNNTPASPVELVQWARRSLERTKLKEVIAKDNEDPAQAASKWENVEELFHSIGQTKTEELTHLSSGMELLREFLNRMALEGRAEEESRQDSKDDANKNEVTLLTLHGAKGLEFPFVYLVGMEDGFLPHKRTIEEGTDISEERRLCYVGLTRAKDYLVITRAKHRIRFGKPVPRYRSRFLNEISESLIVARDLSSGKSDLSGKAQEEHEVRVKNFLADIRSRIAPS